MNGVAGNIFAGLSFSFDDGTLFYNAELADVISPQAGAQAALNYANGSGNAGIQVAGTGGRGSVVMFGFPFETITTAVNRAAVIDRVFDFFGLAAFGPDNADFNRSGLVDTADFVVWRKNNNASVEPGTRGDANHDGLVNSNDYQIWRAQYGMSPPASSAAMGSSNIGVAVAPSRLATTLAQHPRAAGIEANGYGKRVALPAPFSMAGRRPIFQQSIQSTPPGWCSLLTALVERGSRDDAVEEGTGAETRYASGSLTSVERELQRIEFNTLPNSRPPGYHDLPAF